MVKKQYHIITIKLIKKSYYNWYKIYLTILYDFLYLIKIFSNHNTIDFSILIYYFYLVSLFSLLFF
jgi:hypothetical protein